MANSMLIQQPLQIGQPIVPHSDESPAAFHDRDA
jgi:hypothetical protein